VHVVPVAVVVVVPLVLLVRGRALLLHLVMRVVWVVGCVPLVQVAGVPGHAHQSGPTPRLGT
jgi:hypothetical protein